MTIDEYNKMAARLDQSMALNGVTLKEVSSVAAVGADAEGAALNLFGVSADVSVIDLRGLPEQGDASEVFDAVGPGEQAQQLSAPAPSGALAPSDAEEDEGEGRKRSQTDLLVAFAHEHFVFLHDRNGDAYAQDRQTHQVRKLGSRQFKDHLLAHFYEKTKVAVRDQALREAMSTLQAVGRFSGGPQDVYVRSAEAAGRYYIDLCQPSNSRAVELDGHGWRIVDRPPVLFVRTDSMQPLPEPAHGGSIAPLWAIANVPQTARLLVLTWLIDSLRPETPFPGLELVGEQGSGKSTTAEALRRLIDPNACNLRGAPKTVDDLFVTAGQNHFVAYENLSHLPAQMQDALAILSTGGGYAKRQLYTDGDEHVINVRRPWMVNGISVCVTQQDLVDRTISVECPAIEVRQASSPQWKEFEAARPGMLGALLDVASGALAVLPKMALPPDNRPRLVEYVLLGMAVAEAAGDRAENFQAQFKEMRSETVNRTLDASPVAAAVLDLIENNPLGMTATMKDTLAALERYKPQGADAWPRSPKGLGDALRRAAPALRQVGVECTLLGKGSGGVARCAIKKKVSETKSQMSQVPKSFATEDAVGLGTSGTCRDELSAGVEL